MKAQKQNMKLDKQMRNAVKSKQKEFLYRQNLEKKLQLTEDELSLCKKHYKKIQLNIRKQEKETNEMRESLEEFKEQNEDLKKKITEKEKIFNEVVLYESKKLMKNSNNEIGTVIAKKELRDEYKKTIIHCNSYMAMGSNFVLRNCKKIEKVLTNVQESIDKTKKDIKNLRAKQWHDKTMSKSEMQVYKMVAQDIRERHKDEHIEEDITLPAIMGLKSRQNLFISNPTNS